MVAAPEEVEQGPVVGALVEIVGAVAAIEGVSPDEGAVRVGVSVQEDMDGLIEGGEEVALEDRPGRRLEQGESGVHAG